MPHHVSRRRVEAQGRSQGAATFGRLEGCWYGKGRKIYIGRPTARYARDETMLVKEYDTTVPGKANTGHTFGSQLCPDTSDLDPVANRREIEQRILQSPVGSLLAYLKTL